MNSSKPENNKKKKTQEQIWTERLSSPNEEVVKDTIKEIRDYGNVKILYAIIERYASEKNEDIKKELGKLLMDIKHSDAVGLIFSYIKDNKYLHIRKDLISFLWQSRLDLSPYVSDLVDLFLSEPFEIAFEAFTAIEYMEKSVDKNVAKENIDKLKNQIMTVDESKKYLLVDLISLLKRWA